jgi:hypothetical protein
VLARQDVEADGRHPLRLAEESDIDGTEGPQGVRRTEKQ